MLIVGGICAAVFGAGNLTAHATLGYYAEFEFINDNYVKRARQTKSLKSNTCALRHSCD